MSFKIGDAVVVQGQYWNSIPKGTVMYVVRINKRSMELAFDMDECSRTWTYYEGEVVLATKLQKALR